MNLLMGCVTSFAVRGLFIVLEDFFPVLSPLISEIELPKRHGFYTFNFRMFNGFSVTAT